MQDGDPCGSFDGNSSRVDSVRSAPVSQSHLFCGYAGAWNKLDRADLRKPSGHCHGSGIIRISGQKGIRCLAPYGSVRKRMGQSAGEEGRFCAAAPCGNSPGISSRPGKPEKFYPHDLFLCFQHYPVSRIYGDNRFHALCGEALKSSGTGYFNCKSGQYLFSSGVPCRKNRGASGCEACLWETVCL